MLEKLMPKSDEFFDAFDAQAEASVDGTRRLRALLEDFTEVETKVLGIKEAEHRGDRNAAAAFERLHKQFITPFDRTAIHRLLSRIDDVLDLADSAADKLLLYEIKTIHPGARELAGVLVRAAEKMRDAVRELRSIRQPHELLAACRAIKALENEADVINRASLARLFREGRQGGDPILVMQWKEIYDLIETSVDRCEDVANVIEGVVLEHA